MHSSTTVSPTEDSPERRSVGRRKGLLVVPGVELEDVPGAGEDIRPDELPEEALRSELLLQCLLEGHAVPVGLGSEGFTEAFELAGVFHHSRTCFWPRVAPYRTPTVEPSAARTAMIWSVIGAFFAASR